MFKHQSQQSIVATGNRIPRGFSLIEILVVLMILGILTALIVAAMGPLLTNAKIAETEVAITQLNEIIQQRAKAIADLDLKVEAKRFANSSSLNEKESEFIIRKHLLRQALPQRIEDLWGLDRDFSTAADNNPQLAGWSNKPTVAPASTETAHSSEVLFWALTEVSQVRVVSNGKSFNVPILELDNFNQNLISSDLGDPDRKEFIDSWGQPLQFYTWSTRLVRPDGMNSATPPTPTNITQNQLSTARLLVSGLPDFNGTLSYSGSGLTNPLNQDPHDPTGILGDDFNSGNTFTYDVNGTNTTGLAFTEANFHTPNTMFFPLLVSSGPDREIGLALPIASGPARHAQSPTATDEISKLTDNITNRQ